MSAPFRIIRPDTGVKAAAREAGEDFKFYLERLLKMIPAEVIGLYLVARGIIQDNTVMLIIWTVVCLVGVVAIRAYGTADAANNKPTDWVHVFISLVALLIWIYTLGDLFIALNIHNPQAGSLMVLAWTFFIPLLYKGPK